MKLKKIEVEGFRTFKNKQVFDLSNYNDNSFVYVTGENKVEQGLGGNDIGKSSLFEALTWCLYGKTSVNLKAGNIVNWDVKTCKVTIELDNVIVSRIQFPNKILINNEVKTQEDIDKIIGIDYHGFLHSVYISQFSDKFFDLDPSDKLKVFSDIMQFNDWVDRSDKAKHKVKKIEDEIQDNSIKLSNCEGQISILNTQDYKTNSLEWESKNKREAENRQIKINNYKEEINELANKKIIAIEKRKSLGERINELKIDLEKENELLNEIKLDYENKKDKTIKLSVNVSNKQKDLTNFRKVEAICGVCYQTVKREHKSKTLATMKNAYEILSENYKESKKERDESYKIFNEQSKMRDNIKEELYAQESKEPKIRAEINNCEANIIRINKFLIELEGGLQKTKDAINPYHN